MSHDRDGTVVDLLGLRKGMRDFTYFVGRREVVRELRSAFVGNPAWLYGARRIGKSSLARRVQAIAQAEGRRCKWVDLSDVDANHFTALLARATDGAGSSGDGLRLQFEALARTTQEGSELTIVCDEMDAVAPNLRTDEQAFLRRLTHEYQGFSYLFISRASPFSGSRSLLTSSSS